MHQPPPQRVEPLRWKRFAAIQIVQRWSQRKNQPQPDGERDWISDRVPKNDGKNEAIHQSRRAQQRVDDDHVVPGVEDAPDDLGKEWCESDDEQRVLLEWPGV